MFRHWIQNPTELWSLSERQQRTGTLSLPSSLPGKSHEHAAQGGSQTDCVGLPWMGRRSAEFEDTKGAETCRIKPWMGKSCMWGAEMNGRLPSGSHLSPDLCVSVCVRVNSGEGPTGMNRWHNLWSRDGQEAFVSPPSGVEKPGSPWGVG